MTAQWTTASFACALPRRAKLPRHSTEAESQRLETFLAQRRTGADRLSGSRTCVWLLLHSGLRRGECVICVSATGILLGSGSSCARAKARRIAWSIFRTSPAKRCTATWRAAAPSDPLWRLPNGQPLTDQRLRKHLAVIGQHLQIEPFYPHRLRHTCATRWSMPAWTSYTSRSCWATSNSAPR